jgi:hypothetical protein
MVEDVDGAGQSGEMTVKVSGDKVRTDIIPKSRDPNGSPAVAVSTIADTTTGETITIMHAQKTYLVIPAAASKAMAEQMARVMQQNGGGAAAGNALAPKATGKTDKINGYTAAEYTFGSGNLKATYWMSTDFPNGKAVNDALAKFRQGSLAEMTKAFAPDTSTLPGVPVKTETDFNGQKVVTELLSATEATVDPTEFQAPAGYTEMKMPVMPPQ